MLDKRLLKKSDYRIFHRELKHLENSGLLSHEKVSEIDSHYDIKQGPSFTKVLLYIGSILIGIGLMSFIASNWSEIGSVMKYLLIIGLFIGVNIAGLKLNESYPKTARSFHYLGIFIFGAGIFLIAQMFHFGGDIQGAFLWWGIGVIPLGYVLRDKWILTLSAVFSGIYLTQQNFMEGTNFPLVAIGLVVVFYYMNSRLNHSRLLGSFSLFFSLATLLLVWINLFNTFGLVDDFLYIILLFYFAIGLSFVYADCMSFIPETLRYIYSLFGQLLHGTTAIVLTFGDVWPSDVFSIFFSILYFLLVLYFIRSGSLMNIVILCVLIFRFYIDIGIDFMPKSLVFIVGGLILIGFGFLFEKQRRKGGKIHD